MEEEWTTDANEAITISLVKPTDAGLKKLNSFNPRFTYSIFGEDERIFGYKGLNVHLTYDATDMRPNLSVTYAKKFQTVGEVEALNVVETLNQYLPGVAFQKRADFEQAVKNVPEKWTPPGRLVKTIERDGETYEIWKGSLTDPAVKQLLNRVQICVLFFIEGGSYAGKDAEGNDEPDYCLERWSIYFLFNKQTIPDRESKRQYTFQGYASVFDFWMYELATPPSSPHREDAHWELPQGGFPVADLPHRARISQFLILPPFQGKGAGAMLYNTIYELQMKDPAVKEVTVEDPNEAFDLLRDLCDLKYLRENVPEFASLAVNPTVPVPKLGGTLHHDTQISLSPTGSNGASSASKGIVDIGGLEQLRVKVKIAPRQFARLVELHLMSKLPASVRPQQNPDALRPKASEAERHLYTLWRILLKQRLYRRNLSALAEFEVTERIIKLNETLENVEWEYAGILQRLVAPRPGKGPEAVTGAIAGATNGSAKRKLEDEVTNGEAQASKKARVEDA